MATAIHPTEIRQRIRERATAANVIKRALAAARISGRRVGGLRQRGEIPALEFRESAPMAVAALTACIDAFADALASAHYSRGLRLSVEPYSATTCVRVYGPMLSREDADSLRAHLCWLTDGLEGVAADVEQAGIRLVLRNR